MSITTLHPLYQKRMEQWRTLRDVFEGEDAIKRAGPRYLPVLSGQDKDQYNAYKIRARWNNYTARNLDGMHGLIFRRSPQIKCSDDFKNTKILENIDRRGTNLYQFVSDTVYDLMKTGFGGYLIDLPQLNGVHSKREAELNGIRPYLRYYPAESITNWSYGIINGVEQLCYVVLKEEVESNEDEFEHHLVTQYRVLDARSGTYTQRLFKEYTDKNGSSWEEENLNVEVNGKGLTELPFLMLPGKEPEKPMFYDLAMCNIGHYQKSADYENGVHLTTIPTGYVTGHRQALTEEGEREIIELGHDAFLMFEEENAKVGTLVFSGEGLTHSENAIKQSLADMSVLGSRLIAPDNGNNESADSAKVHRAGENAFLATFAKNISDGLSKALTLIAEWEGFDEKIEVQLCTDYDTLSFDANALNSLANLAKAGKLPLPYIFYNLANGEYAPAEADLEEYATLLQMEASGMTLLDEIEYLKQKRAGIKSIKKFEDTINKTPAKNIEQEDITDNVEEV